MMRENKPFLLKPAPKDYLWGGNKLNDVFGKGIDMSPLAETWECSTHPDGQSTVDSGPHRGALLGEVLHAHPQYLGQHPLRVMGRPELPILIKLIDARQDLSVQVHPDDAYALAHENSLGKTEMWYVLDAEDGAGVVYGFTQNMEKTGVRAAIERGDIRRYLNRVPARKDDIFYIEAGTVHAIGAGLLIAEIQESSNVTYRLYDYDRLDRDGRARALHVDQALGVARLKASDVPRQPMRVLRYRKGCASELLTRCKYFQVERLLLNTGEYRSAVAFRTESNSFHVLLCTEGEGLMSGDGVEIRFTRGACIFIPAESVELQLCGMAQLLNVSC